MSLEARSLVIRAGERRLVSELTLEFAAGEFIVVLGLNGSGKTLTLHTLAGLRAAAEGSVWLAGTPIERLARRAIARRLGVLTQDTEEGFTTSVLESVLISRHPHLKPLEWEGADDRRIAASALERVGLAELAHRGTDTLSGGERRRAAIAALLAQDPQILLLDEPTNHLDPHHQLAVLELFHGLARAGRTVVATLHDATLAARFADRALLLFGDGRWRAGAAAELLNAKLLGELYLTPMLELEVQGRKVFVSA
jgi:iron complex transport system ATP-binding protein